MVWQHFYIDGNQELDNQSNHHKIKIPGTLMKSDYDQGIHNNGNKQS